MGFVDLLLGRSSTKGKPDVAAVRRRMRELAGEGRFSAALDYAQPHALRLADPALSHELTELRRQAAEEAIAQAVGRADWPPAASDPRPDLVGIPEIAVADLTAETMQGAILHHGSLIVRGAVAREEAMGIAGDIDRVFAAWDATANGTAVPADSDWFLPFNLRENDHTVAHGREWTRGTGGILAADSPVLFNRLVDLYRRRGLAQAIETHLGERPVLSVGKTVLRRVHPTNPGDFHQDGAFLGSDVRTINVWIALSDCGEDAPGLEVVDCRVPHIVDMGTDDASFEWSAGRSVASAANGGRPFARPTFKAGDAIVFDQLMLHATSHSPLMNRPRYALEAWFFAPSSYAEKQIALLV